MLLLVEDVVDLVPAYWACLKAGKVAVPLTSAAQAALAGRPQAWQASHELEKPLVATDSTFAGVAATHPGADVVHLSELRTGDFAAAVQPADPACLIQTSGSTGRPRFAALSAQALLTRSFRVDPSEATHVCGFGIDAVTLLRSSTLGYKHWVQVPPVSAFGQPLSMLDAVEAMRAKGLLMSTSLARLILDHASGRTWDLSSLRTVSWGLERIDAATAYALGELLTRNGAVDLGFKWGYGTTETGLISSAADGWRVPMSDVGRVTDTKEARIVDGVVEVKDYPGMFSGYVGEPDGSGDGFTPDGWWITGDRGSITDGVLTLDGRTKDVVIINGAKHSLVEIEESVMIAFDKVVAVACAITDPATGAERLGLAVISAEPINDDVAGFVAAQFGIAPDPVVRLTAADIPRSSGGKVQRPALAALLVSLGRPTGLEALTDERSSATVATIWRDVLGIVGPLVASATFASLGGDSLRAAQLFARIESELGVLVPVGEFFAQPTLANLERVTGQVGFGPDNAAPTETRAEELVRKQLTHVSTWPGDRPTDDPLLTALNLGGTRPPIAWVFQGAAEFTALAAALGPDQPLYGMRSGHTLMGYDEDDIQTFALRYARAVDAACPDGPIVVGGNCQGGVMALAMAQHLIRRGREIPLLALLDWLTDLQPYTGNVLVIHGKPERHRIPYVTRRSRTQSGQRLYRRVRVSTLPAGHGHYFQPGVVERLARILTTNINRTSGTWRGTLRLRRGKP